MNLEAYTTALRELTSKREPFAVATVDRTPSFDQSRFWARYGSEEQLANTLIPLGIISSREVARFFIVCHVCIVPLRKNPHPQRKFRECDFVCSRLL